MNNDDEIYPCVGICQADPDSGYCLGCGRPPMDAPGIVAELSPPVVGSPAQGEDPDTPP